MQFKVLFKKEKFGAFGCRRYKSLALYDGHLNKLTVFQLLLMELAF